MNENKKKKTHGNQEFVNKSRIKHLAVIMDGNGRWAEKNNHKRIFGHVQGAKQARSFIQYCSQLGLPFLSLFALSTENILRPENEVKALQKLLEKVFLKHSHFLMQEQIKLHILGDISIFPSSLQSLCKTICEKTKNHQGLNLIVALNYGGQQEILKAVQKIAEEIEQKKLQVKELNEKSLSAFLSSSHFPPPDLIIRTGGQSRLSNFYLWSSAYSELYFTDTLWPEFDRACLDKALQKFQRTQRRFGKNISSKTSKFKADQYN